ncbi:MAG: WD40 repeat domain-containing protein, partial [Thermoanaerobaculia bacterium]
MTSALSAGSHFITGANDGTVRVWLLATAKETARFEDVKPICDIRLDPKSRLIAIVTETQTRVCALDDKGAQQAFIGVSSTPTDSGVLLPSRKWNIVAQDEEFVHVRSSGNDSLQLPVAGRVLSAEFSPDGRYLAVLCHTRHFDNFGDCRPIESFLRSRVAVWDLTSGGRRCAAWGDGALCEHVNSGDWTGHLEWIAEGRCLVVHYDIVDDPSWGGAEFRMGERGWSAFARDNAIWLTKGDGTIQLAQFSFSPDSRSVAVQHQKTVSIVELASGRIVAEMTHEPTVAATAFSPDSKFVATCGADCMVRLSEIATGALVMRFSHDSPVTHLTFCDDGSLLATGTTSKVSIWTTEGEEICRVECDVQPQALSFTPDGHCLVLQLPDGTHTNIWLDLARLTAASRQRLTRNLTLEEWQEFMGEEPYRRTFDGLI